MSSSSTGGLVGGIIGGIIASVIPGVGTALGFSIGASLGSSLFAETKEATREGPRLDDLKAKKSAYGEPLPIIYGNYRTGTSEIWRENNKLNEVRREDTQEQGGKGGGGAETTTVTYDYYLTAAFSISIGEIGGVRRIWAASKLIYDGTDNPSPEVITKGADVIQNAGEVQRSISSSPSKQSEFGLIKIYNGSVDQNPDPRIEADIGVGKTPAYRGIAYMVIEDLKVNDFGNTTPPIEVEVASNQDFTPRRITFLDPVPTGISGTETGKSQSVDFSDGSVNVLTADDQIYRVDSYATNGQLVERGDEINWRDNISFNTDDPELSQACINDTRFAIATDLFLNSDAKSQFWIAQGQPDSKFIDIDNNGNTRGYRIRGRVFVSLGGSVFCYGQTISKDENNNLTSSNTKILRFPIENFVVNLGTIVSMPSVSPDIIASPFEDNISGRHMTVDQDGFFYVWTGGGFTNEIVKFDQEINVIERIPWFDHDNSRDRNFVIWQGWFFGTVEDGVDDSAIYNLETQNVVAETPNDKSVFNVAPLAGGPLALGSDGSIWTMQPQQSSEGQTVSSIISDIANRSNLENEDIDVSQISKTVSGFAVSKPTNASQAIGAIRPFGQFDASEVDYKLQFIPRGGNAIRTLGQNDLAAHEEDQDRPAVVEEERELETELPKRAHVKYSDVERDYEDGEQYAGRQIVRTTDEIRKELPIAMSPDEAAQLADTLLRERWQSRSKLKVVTTWKHLDLTPGDVINVLDFEGNQRTGRITKIDEGRPGLVNLDIVPDGPNVYNSTAKGVANDKATLSPVVGGPTKAIFLDVPPLRSKDNNAGYYLAMAGALDGWRGATLFESSDGGDSFDSITTSTTKAGIAKTTEALKAGPTTVWDRGNTLNVSPFTAEFESRLEEAVLNGQGSLAIQSGNEWEIVQYANAVLENDGTYTLSKLLRGRKGTEHLVGKHAKNDTVVVLNKSNGSINRIEQEEDAIGTSKAYKAVTIGNDLASAKEKDFKLKGISLRPFSPSHVKSSYENGDIKVEWIRRNRIIGEWRNNTDVPMSEDSEEYEVTVSDEKGKEIRTDSTNKEEFVYTTSEQNNDGLEAEGLFVETAQVSSVFGPGIKSSTTAVAGGGFFDPFLQQTLDASWENNFVKLSDQKTFSGNYSMVFTKSDEKDSAIWKPDFNGSSIRFREFSCIYQETNDSKGFVIVFKDINGNEVFGIGSNNPEPSYWDGSNGWSELAIFGGDVDNWIKLRIYDIDWSTGNHVIEFKNLTDDITGAESVSIANPKPIGEISIYGRQPNLGSNSTSSSNVVGNHWFDSFKLAT